MEDLARDTAIRKVRADAEKSCQRWEQAFAELQERHALELAEERRRGAAAVRLRRRGACGRTATGALDELAREGGILAAAIGGFPARLARFLAFKHVALLSVSRSLQALLAEKEVEMLRVVGTRRERVLRGILDTTKSALKQAAGEAQRQKTQIKDLEAREAQLRQAVATSKKEEDDSAVDARIGLVQLQVARDEELKAALLELDRTKSELAEAQVRAEKDLEEIDIKMAAKEDELKQLPPQWQRTGNTEHRAESTRDAELDELHFQLVTAKYHAGSTSREMEEKKCELEEVRLRLSSMEHEAQSRAKEIQRKDTELEELRFAVRTLEHKAILLTEHLDEKDAELERARDFSSSYLSTLRYKTTGTYPSVSSRSQTPHKREKLSDEEVGVLSDEVRAQKKEGQGAISFAERSGGKDAIFWDDDKFADEIVKRQKGSVDFARRGESSEDQRARLDPSAGSGGGEAPWSISATFSALFARSGVEQSTPHESEDPSSPVRPASPPLAYRHASTPPQQATPPFSQRSSKSTPTSATMPFSQRSAPLTPTSVASRPSRKVTMIPTGPHGQMIRCPCQMMAPGDTSMICDCDRSTGLVQSRDGWMGGPSLDFSQSPHCVPEGMGA